MATEDDTVWITSESATEGQSDKICDQVSEAILDACLKDDPASRVDCRTVTKSNMVMVLGEIVTKSKVHYETVIRDTLKKIGYDSVNKGMDYRTVNIAVAVDDSVDLASTQQAERKDEELCLDQGQVIGYASDECEECMPLSHVFATKLAKRLTEIRQQGLVKWAMPDGQTQVTMEYKREKGMLVPTRVHSIAISAQKPEDNVSATTIENDLTELVIKHVVEAKYLDEKTLYSFNSSRRFVLGGPRVVAGQSGRFTLQDTYGGWEAVADNLVGKDATRRCGIYAARWIAKSLVCAKLCRRVRVKLTYAIGVARPVAIHLDTFGTSSKSEKELVQLVETNFDLRPGIIIKQLQLNRPIYAETACYGHFGRQAKKLSESFTWEIPKPIALPSSPM